MATGEYGDFTQQLSKAAVDNRWRTTNSYINQPIRPIEQFEIEPVKSTVTRINSNDSREMYNVPSEWNKFLVLMGRCNIHYYRDWV